MCIYVYVCIVYMLLINYQNMADTLSRLYVVWMFLCDGSDWIIQQNNFSLELYKTYTFYLFKLLII